jgi:hypothetical protein
MIWIAPAAVAMTDLPCAEPVKRLMWMISAWNRSPGPIVAHVRPGRSRARVCEMASGPLPNVRTLTLMGFAPNSSGILLSEQTA